MGAQHGNFLWYELMTTDVDAAAAFYGEVIGWSSRPFDPTDPSGYRLLATADTEIGGLMALPQDGAGAADARPGWIGYIGVDDLDAAAAAIVADGGHQLVPPTDIPDIGRFAVVADPQGVPFAIIHGTSEGESRAFSPEGIGHCRWNELTTSDPEAAFAFYARHFGWTKGEAMPMGEAGVYQLLENGGVNFGAVTRAGPETAGPAWSFYFGVPDIDAGLERIVKAGGTVLHGPHQVPGDEFIVIASDPQGAVFSLVGPRKA